MAVAMSPGRAQEGSAGLCSPVGTAGVDLDEVPLEVLERTLVAGWAEQSAHMARWLGVLAAFDRRGGWEGLGYVSCAHWLAVHCGISQATGADHVRVAHRLGVLPAVSGAFSSGRLSYSKVRALCRVATPDTEDELLALARDTSAGQLERLLGVLERQRNGAGLSEDEAEARRGVRTWVDDEGLEHIEIVAWPEEAALIKVGIDYGRDQIYAERRAAAKAAEAEGMPRPPVEAPSRIESLGWTVAAGVNTGSATRSTRSGASFAYSTSTIAGMRTALDPGPCHRPMAG